MYSLYITTLWIFFGLISWIVGRAGQNFPAPKEETLEYLRKEQSRKYIVPSSWAITLCGLPSCRREIADSFFMHVQLGGILLIILSGFAGFLISTQAFWLGVSGSLVLYHYIPRWIINQWPQS